ncbi:MAG: hypothetical protein R2731_17130 [Nocardioides sp.]
MFGGLLVSSGGAALPSEISHIARDPVDPLFDDEELIRRVRRRTSAVKRLLLDQTLVSGVGNIYADEACGAPGCTANGPGTGSPGPRCASCSGTSATCSTRRWARGGPPSTRST